MWFIGLIVGALIGAMGGGGGALIGAAVGAAVGLALASRKQPIVDDKWKQDIEDALKRLHQRVKELERPGASRAPEQKPGAQVVPDSEEAIATPAGVPLASASVAEAAPKGAPAFSPEVAVAYELVDAHAAIVHCNEAADFHLTCAAINIYNTDVRAERVSQIGWIIVTDRFESAFHPLWMIRIRGKSNFLNRLALIR